MSDNLLVPGKYSLCLVPTILLDPDSQKEAHNRALAIVIPLEEDPSFLIAKPKKGDTSKDSKLAAPVRAQMRKIAA